MPTVVAEISHILVTIDILAIYQLFGLWTNMSEVPLPALPQALCRRDVFGPLTVVPAKQQGPV